MSSTDWHVAQVNIALPRAPLDDPGLEDFVSRLAPIPPPTGSGMPPTRVPPRPPRPDD
ncbi:MAG TPA: hypothetical protein VFC08_07580 [Actinomycetota bacterium]|nr:hypothetical protein [Actinomycetota bacterium]